MILRNQVEWALHCVSLLAALPEGKRLATTDLAKFHGVPKEYLLKALQELSKAGIVDGSIGQKGGYMLARHPGEITFLDVIEAIEGNKSTFICTEIRQNSPCDTPKSALAKPCQVARIMYEADEAWRQVLKKTTIADLAKDVETELPEPFLTRIGQWIENNIN
ncbi:MAG: Rrf2 family transcriptional regulator [Candidatus Dadabacteria bacterium]|nr:Rrf2 family transcriptional regulator [Candidatus Dadabacteria bacterium]NIV41926.1 Rrf2 family transcriptional regulator [Candidatus Dadabacteria bacterium]NIX15797.1 Rrf2 family transcriptional regulator [Candidatus Dadabacteria bacterium]